MAVVSRRVTGRFFLNKKLRQKASTPHRLAFRGYLESLLRSYGLPTRRLQIAEMSVTVTTPTCFTLLTHRHSHRHLCNLQSSVLTNYTPIFFFSSPSVSFLAEECGFTRILNISRKDNMAFIPEDHVRPRHFFFDSIRI